jgi:hypothetical protein
MSTKAKVKAKTKKRTEKVFKVDKKTETLLRKLQSVHRSKAAHGEHGNINGGFRLMDVSLQDDGKVFIRYQANDSHEYCDSFDDLGELDFNLVTGMLAFIKNKIAQETASRQQALDAEQRAREMLNAVPRDGMARVPMPRPARRGGPHSTDSIYEFMTQRPYFSAPWGEEPHPSSRSRPRPARPAVEVLEDEQHTRNFADVLGLNPVQEVDPPSSEELQEEIEDQNEPFDVWIDHLEHPRSEPDGAYDEDFVEDEDDDSQ